MSYDLIRFFMTSPNNEKLNILAGQKKDYSVIFDVHRKCFRPHVPEWYLRLIKQLIGLALLIWGRGYL